MRRILIVGVVVAAAAVAYVVRGGFAGPPRDTTPAIAEELARWKTALADANRADEFWTQVKPGAQSLIDQADRALADGRRLMAIERLLIGRQNLAAANYVAALPAGATDDLVRLEAEWKRMAAVLGVGGTAAPGRDGSALRRAFEEAAAQQLQVYYDASLPYAKNTTPSSGYSYLGIAQSQWDIGQLAPALVPEDGRRQPPLRSIRPDIDALQGEVLALYRPPLSIERHPDFIATSALLKEARELDAAGRRYGALLRFLQAAMRFGLLAPSGDAVSRADARARAAAEQQRAAAGRIDHSLAALFAERAAYEVDHATGDGPVPAADAILTRVLPRYYAAIGAPAGATAPTTQAAVTITLVRWPYT